MKSSNRQSVAAIVIAVLVAAAMAWAGSQGGVRWAGVPVFALCAGLAFAINWAAFVPAFARQSERYFDLTGSLTYLCVVGVALAASGSAPNGTTPRATLLALLVAVWATRLGRFLFARILREGADRRFDALKPDFLRFLATWTLQALWVLVTVSCALAAITSTHPAPLGAFALLGSAIWLAGFVIEATADAQKRRFRAEPALRDRFIDSGLWAWSRHPNYFGEIVLWLGVAVVALPALSGWQHVTLVSPLFVYFLLTRVSGIPMLEARARARWGDDPTYREYLERTPRLFPLPPRA